MPITFTDTPLYYKDSQGNYHRVLSGADMTGYRTAAAQDAIDAGKEAAGLGLTGASVGDLVRVNAVDSSGKPTSWKRVALNEIKCNKNLLDNWYFVGGGSQIGDGVFPINQRGQTTYSSTGYGIDSWLNSNVSITSTNLQSNCLHLVHTGNDGYIVQRGLSKNLAGQETCLSILLADGSLYSFSSIFPYANESSKNSPTYANKLRLSLENKSDRPSAVIVCKGENDIDIVAVKLELGSEQTLAHNEGTEQNPVWVLNELPDYGEELAKCQRYYQLFRTESLRPTYGEDCRPTMATAQPTKRTLTKDGVTYYTLSSEP